MPYCAECGIRYQSDDLVCTGCGSKRVKKSTLETGEAEPDHKEPEVLNTVLAGNLESLRAGQGPIDGSQLGKGLIKPNSVVLESDGSHFKYDQPSRNLTKAGPLKDKVVEFRLTCPDPESKEQNEMNDSAPVFIPPVEALDTTPTGESDDEIEVEEISPERDEQSLDSSLWIAGEITADLASNANLEDESIPVSKLPEPELEATKEIEVLWEDSGRWLGIPAAKHYRITNHSLQIIDRSLRRFSEVDLSLISDVKLQQSWFGKLFGTGALLISVENLPGSQLALTGVRNPGKVHLLLEELIHPEL
jgi:hypothetical protein